MRLIIRVAAGLYIAAVGIASVALLLALSAAAGFLAGTFL